MWHKQTLISLDATTSTLQRVAFLHRLGQMFPATEKYIIVVFENFPAVKTLCVTFCNQVDRCCAV